MIGARTLLLLALCSILVTALGIELDAALWDVSAVNSPPATAPASSHAMTPPMAPGRPDGWAAVALARPLFARDRRPSPPNPGAPASASSVLPRLSGVMIDGASRRAIFAGTDGEKPVTATEGADVAGFKVQNIEAGQVTVLGQGGPRVVRPSFDPRATVNPATLGPANLGTVPGVPSLRGPTAMPHSLPPNSLSNASPSLTSSAPAR
jgi:hypothetical protein